LPAAQIASVPGYTLTDDTTVLDRGAVHAYLTGSYWARGRTRGEVDRSIDGSAVCIGAFDSNGNQVGFCRAISDETTFAYVADVFVLEGHRGKGIARWMMATIIAHPRLQGLRRVLLATRDAHAVYESVGFVPLLHPERWMELPNGTLAPREGQSIVNSD
jgi:GNAT superfamily N-acetyltransferase